MSPRHTLLVLIALFAASPAHGQESRPDTTGLAGFLAMVNRPIVLTAPGADRVRVRENLTYRTVAGRPQLADVYVPRAGKAPIVVLVHGGVGPELPLRPKDWGFYRTWGRLLAASGMVAVTFNHRLGFPAPELEAAGEDVDSLFAFVRGRAKEWGGDPDRIALMSFSAGGMLLAPQIRDSPPWLRGIVALYPIIDLRGSAHLERQLTPAQLEAWSAATHLPAAAAKMPPLMVVRAGRDQIPDLLAGLDRFAAEALRTNAPVVLVNHPDAPHGFDNDTATPRTLEVLRLTIGFLKSRLVEGAGT
jgi:acetyl esterase/lipase